MSNEQHKEHIIPLSTYLGVFSALVALTAITVWIAQFHFGEWNLIVAMSVAVVKALLVAFIFMHLLYDNKLYATVFAGSIVFLAVFIVFTMYDTLRRDDIYEQVGKPIKSKAIIYENMPVKKDSTAHSGH